MLNSVDPGVFNGVLTEYQACIDAYKPECYDGDNTPAEAFDQLRLELNGPNPNQPQSTAGIIGWTTDISWQWTPAPAIN